MYIRSAVCGTGEEVGGLASVRLDMFICSCLTHKFCTSHLDNQLTFVQPFLGPLPLTIAMELHASSWVPLHSLGRLSCVADNRGGRLSRFVSTYVKQTCAAVIPIHPYDCAISTANCHSICYGHAAGSVQTARQLRSSCPTGGELGCLSWYLLWVSGSVAIATG